VTTCEAVIQPIKVIAGVQSPTAQPPGLAEPRYSRPGKRTMTFQPFPIMVYNQFLSSLLAQGIIPRFTKETKIIQRLGHMMNRRSLSISEASQKFK
jgi:hypothetical protein